MIMMFLIERSEYDDDVSDRKIRKIRVWWWCFYVDDVSDQKIRMWWWWCCYWSRGQSTEDVAADRKVKVLKMLLLIEKSKVLKMLLIKMSKCWRCCCWSKSQSAKDVADRKAKMMKMLLLIEQSKCWRCCWLKGPSAEDVIANWKIKMLKMMLIKEWRCCWWWRLKIEDEDYMMLKSFQWFIDVLPCWYWWCLISLLL